jgi:hypothetical protein
MVLKTLSQKKKNPSQKRAVGVAQDIGPEFEPQYYKTKKSQWSSCIILRCEGLGLASILQMGKTEAQSTTWP